jgi:hypothetical protein
MNLNAGGAPMKLSRNQLIFASILAVTLAGLAGLTGCGDANLLETTVGVLTLEFQVSDPGSTQYEVAVLLVANVTVRPVDQDAQDSLGGADIALLANEVRSIDLASSSTTLNPTSLPAAVFTLDSVLFFPDGRAPIELQDTNPDPMASCLDRKPALPETPDETTVIASALFDISKSRRTINPNALITIPSGGTLNHPITINSSLLIQAYKNAMTCSDVVATCQQRFNSLAAVPCLMSFDANQFLDELDTLDWVSF